MATKKPTPKKKASAEQLLALAQKALGSEAVRAMLVEVPDSVLRWANKRRKEWKASDPSDRVRRMNPANRFGQQGLERRARDVREALAAVFPPSDPARLDVEQALDEVDRGLIVAARLPLLKRKRAQSRVDDALDRIERALVEAVLPKD